MSVVITKPVRRRPQFHPLCVSTVDRLTDDAVAVEFAVPEELREQFAFRAGQHLTVRRVTDAEDARRSYSICSTPAELDASGRIRIGVRAVAGGVFSTYALHDLQPGQTVDVLPPLGGFTTGFDPGRARHYAAPWPSCCTTKCRLPKASPRRRPARRHRSVSSRHALKWLMRATVSSAAPRSKRH